MRPPLQRAGVLAGLVLLAAGCTAPREATRPPALLLGTFEDDYGIRHTITPDLWTQHPGTRYRLHRWRPGEGFLLARNDSANAHAPGRWTRLDWMPFSDQAPYTWGFCLTAFEAPSAAAAAAHPPPNRHVPRTGCNGYPFSRMRRVAAP